MSGPAARAPAPDDRGLGAVWMRFWFEPTDPRPLALVRILVGLLGLALLWSWQADLGRWCGPEGLVTPASAAAWVSRGDGAWLAVVDAALGPRGVWAIAVASFAALVVGAGGTVVAVTAACSLSLLLHRAPMLAGPADDCLVILTWCTAVAPSTRALSLDRVLAGRGRVASAVIAPPAPSWRAQLATGLLQVHASVIALAAAIAQLKGDVWWDGTAAWWLAARAESRVVDLTSAYAGSTYLMNLATHAIPAFEVAFAVGLWASAVRPAIARLGLVAWPAVGVLVGEPFWGLAMTVFAVPFTGLAWGAAASPSHPVTRRAGAA
jgi:hypothetical protein